MRDTYFQFFILVVLNMIDVWFTYLMLNSGGMEINPLIVATMAEFGIIHGMLIVKIPILLTIGWLIYMHRNYQWFTTGRLWKCDFPRVLDISIAIYLGIDVYTFILLHIP